jgi:D-alanine transaminase
MPEVIYLNGRRVPRAEACISIDDRGFLFGEAVYDVIRGYRGRLWAADRHFRRLARNVGEVGIGGVDLAQVQELVDRALVESGFDDANVYIHITRGAEPRKLVYSEALTPTVLIQVRDTSELVSSDFCDGVAAITVPDLRWRRCDIKTTLLLPNALARKAARRAGAYEAIFYDEQDVVTEAAAMSVFAVAAGELYTHPAGSEILPSISREFVLEIAGELGISVREERVRRDRFARMEEIFLTSTSHEVCPVITLDGAPVGDGKVGPIARRILQRFQERIAAGDDAPRGAR